MMRNLLRPVFWASCVLALLALTEKPLSAGPTDPTETVTENGMTIGTISIDVSGSGVTGNFTPANDPKTGKPYTLAALAKSLGEDHFNWLQDYTQSTDIKITSLDDPNKPNGTTHTTTYTAGQTIIDPQSGGQAFNGSKNGQWADGAPWYYDESLPASVDGKTVTSKDGTKWTGDSAYLLSNQISNNGSTLNFSDVPSDKNVTINFKTFLVSVGPGNTYKPLAGFSWSVTFDKNGKATVTLDSKGGNLTPTPFTDEINKEVNSQNFGKWTLATPEPSTLVLLASAVIGLAPYGLRRRSQLQS